ncbi:hypothetical protein JVU11DRAFT_2368 [Chiua virens]|nr:hypothetical protein JVU11DRAFT_2368 [Chiua virens]
MYNPLALALESMRGRPSLRFMGTVCLRDVWTDETGDVYMDIHPYATLTRIYFENVLCLSRLVAPPHDVSGLKQTEMGVRVSLGDTGALYCGIWTGNHWRSSSMARRTRRCILPPLLVPSGMSKQGGPPPLSMRVARITTAPRAPRPDDPTPRQPPARSSRGITLSDLGANKRIVPPSNGVSGKDKCKETEDQVLRRAREVMLHLPRSKGKEQDQSPCQRDGVFKVPEVPAKVRREQGDIGTDVFGAVASLQPRSVHGKSKAKATVTGHEDGENENESTIEGANKLVLKRLVVHYLAEMGIPRSHVEFKEIFGFVYRGASFALRSQLKTLPICTQAAEVIVEAHVKMYVLMSDGADASQGNVLPMPDTNAPMNVDEDDTGE